MSDDEMPPTGAGDEDFSDDEEMGMGSGPASLPEGVQKEILTEAGPDSWKTPKAGDEVTVHYVGTLQSDGSEFDSSRGRDQPFVFTLGKGQVIKGWDVGVATMKKGEIAKFTLAPEFAYGAGGSPPKIPENATLVFEVELISWMSKDDLFGDEGAIKTQLKEGSGWRTPAADSEVVLSLKATAADGTVIEERSGFEYTVGSDSLGALSKACNKVLKDMKKGEEAQLKLTKDYAYGDKHPEGATVVLTLQEMYETKDVSVRKDKSVMKKQIKEGEGWDTPKDSSSVKLRVESATDGSAPIPGFQAQTLEFTAGNGDVCDALELAVVEMKQGERATLTVCPAAPALEARLGLKDATADRIVLTLEMVEFVKAKDSWSMEEAEKIEHGAARKDVGSALFKQGRLGLALQRYKQVADLLSYVDSYKEEDNKTKAKAVRLACQLNQAAVQLKLKEYGEAKTACNAVLKDEKSNAKALYRRAQAELGLKNFQESIADCKKVIEVDPQSKEARALLKQAQACQREEDKKAKGLFANMCKALGKGPIPPPGKAAPVGDFGDDDEDEDMPPPPAEKVEADAKEAPMEE